MGERPIAGMHHEQKDDRLQLEVEFMERLGSCSENSFRLVADPIQGCIFSDKSEL